MRADARRNRERIVAAALDLFAEHGAGVSMEEIAQEAGLGVGTLYRHFPDRRALVEDIATGTLTALRDHVRAGADEAVSRWEVLVGVVRYCAGQPLALITRFSDASPKSETRSRLVHEIDALLADIVEQAQREGSVRDDLTPGQIVGLINVAVCRPGARADDPLATVILDGLSTASTRRGS
ncbi:TetR/AcrR family transcriptional regulator [Nonomuraea insulae]|uniref:TetR/AcrR family transcriptional regulator n=1 Tax=Nonomuraea insulae TaxID=1616787 RepID=A0ABW1CVC0_9ACTN